MEFSFDQKSTLTLIGFVVVAVGWFYDRAKQRSFERYKRGLDKRLEMFSGVRGIWRDIQNANGAPFALPSFLGDLQKTREEVQLFGTSDEIAAFEQFISEIEKKDIQRANVALSIVLTITRKSLRRDLELGDAPLP